MLEKLAMSNSAYPVVGLPPGGYRLNRSARLLRYDSDRSAISSAANHSSLTNSSSISDISNTVGYLQEMMQKGGHPIPQYSPGMEFAAPFSCTVTLHTGQTATGTGANKGKRLH